MAKKQYLALQNLVAPSEWLVLKGAVLDAQDRTQWNVIERESVPKGSIVQAGSTFEAELAKSKLRVWLSMGAVADATETRHFELEQVFDRAVTILGSAMSLGEALRAHGIYTLEEVVDNAKGTIPFSEASSSDGTPIPISAREVIEAFVQPDEVEELIAAAKAAIQA